MLLKINKTYKYAERENGIYQTYWDSTNLPETLTTRKEENNDLVYGKENLSESGKQLDNHQDSMTRL